MMPSPQPSPEIGRGRTAHLQDGHSYTIPSLRRRGQGRFRALSQRGHKSIPSQGEEIGDTAVNNLSRPVRIWLGIASFLPFLTIGLMVLAFIGTAFLMVAAGNNHSFLPWPFFLMFPVVIFINLLYMGLMVFYIIHIINSSRVPHDQQALWVLLLFFLNFLVMPVYWYLYIWREPRGSLGTQNSD